MTLEKNFIKISIPTILIGILGFFLSLYALILHLQNLMRPGRGALCDINAQFSCSAIIGSSYGEIASIPLGSYGMTYFIMIISAAILPKISSLTKKQHSKLEFIIGLVGFISVVSLFYISHFILKTICPTCSIIHIITAIYFTIKIISILKNKRVSNTNYYNSDYLIRFIAVCLCFGIPTLAIGLIAPIILDKYIHSPNKIN